MSSSSRDELDWHYDAKGSVTAELYDRILARYSAMSIDATAALTARRDVPFDPESPNRLDIFGAGEAPRPAFIFLHGGYWRANSKENSAFMAKALAAHGIVTVVVDYTLIPHATLPEIIRQTRQAVAWCHRNGASFGIDPERIFVGGSSAGGHLAAATVTGGWHAAFGLPGNAVKGAVPVSGLFDLDPVSRCFANEWLQLTSQSALELSPLHAIVQTDAALLVAYAAGEPEGFKVQSRAFHDAWLGAGNAAEILEVPGRNHFDVILDLADPGSQLFQRVSRLIGAD